ncbi:MAG TPA: adenylate kinase [Clostridiales bacterium UBA8153]|nr:adenylate kinase [Clostridiales bacterium UBA8153]
MHWVLIGPPGAGKGTQAALLAGRLGIPHISPGDTFRRASRAGTPLGHLAGSFMERGALVPDEVTNALIRERLAEADCRVGFILDGFPRNLAQAGALQTMLEELGLPFAGAISIEVPEEELVRRSVGRRVCRQCGAIYHLETHPPAVSGVCDVCGGEVALRADDREDVAKTRLEVYGKATAVLLDYYRRRGELRTVDGNRPVEQVLAELTLLMRNP